MTTSADTQTPTPVGTQRTSWVQLGVVSAAEFVVWTGFGAIMPFLPIFLRDEAHSSLFMIGLISAMFYLGTLLFSSPFGWLSDMIGRKPVMIGGVMLFAVSMLLFTTTMNPWWFVVFRLLEGIGTAAVAPAAMAYVADVTTDSNRSKAYGILMSAQFGGLIVGPAIGAAALRFLGDGTAGFHAIFYFGAILAALTAVALAAFIREPVQIQERRRARRGAKAEKPPYSQILTPAILAFLLVGFTSHFAMGAFEVVWSLYLRDIGASTTYISATWIAFSVPMLFAFAGGIVADRYSRFILMFTGYTMSAAAWIIYGTTTSLMVFLIVNVIEGFAIAFSYPAKQAFLVQVSPRRFVGTVTGLETTAMQLAGLIGTLAAPVMYGWMSGYVLAFGGVVNFIGLAIAAPVLARAWRRVRAAGPEAAPDETEPQPVAAAQPPFGIE
jgi:DHA1 family multidrug resistance protein-like MFS transporter